MVTITLKELIEDERLEQLSKSKVTIEEVKKCLAIQSRNLDRYLPKNN